MANFQFIPYTLIAVGIINAVYRNSDSTSLNFSYLLILFGSALFLASRNQGMKTTLEKSPTKYVVLIVSALLILLTVIR